MSDPIIIDIGAAVQTLQSNPQLAEEMGRLIWPLGNPQELLQVTRTLIYDILSRPHSTGRLWTYQGLGMVRTPLDADGILRLNVWSDELRIPNISSIHDHPWNLKSYIINGTLTNVRYSLDPRDGKRFAASGVKLGCGAHPNGAHMSDKFIGDLYEKPPETYGVGACYWQHRDEIHETRFGRSAVSLNIRTDKREDGSATVYWPRGTEWVDAKQRVAAYSEVDFACWEAIQTWEDY